MYTVGDRLRDMGVPQSQLEVPQHFLRDSRLFSPGALASILPRISNPNQLGKTSNEPDEVVYTLLDGLHFLSVKGVTLPPSQHSVHFGRKAAQVGRVAFEKGYFKRARPMAVDVGTGTGVIMLSMADELEQQGGGELPFDVMGTDVFAATLTGAVWNAILNNQFKVGLRKNSLLDGAMPGSIDLVVCNPPFLAPPAFPKDKAITAFVPFHAIYGGSDGLWYYRRLLKQADRALSPEGMLMLQFDPPAKEQVAELAQSMLPERPCQFIDVGNQRQVMAVGGPNMPEIIELANQAYPTS